MEPGTSRLLPMRADGYGMDKAANKLFTSILDYLAETDVFSKSESPSIFIVYAHDNAKEGTANSWCVIHLIKWLKAIRSRTVSDKAPLPLWASRVGGSDSIKNILTNQFCLLPGGNISTDVGTVHRVDKVVVCGSELLKRYYQNSFTSSYIDAITTTYDEGRKKSVGFHASERDIRSIVEAKCQHDAFHHVLTELAFLRLRNSYSKDNHGIIPVTLDQDLMAWLPFRDNCDLVLKLKSLNDTGLHQLFFKLLGQIYVEEHVLISKFKECYDQAIRRFQDESDLSEARSQKIVDQEISKAQKALGWIENAALRSRRRDLDRVGSDEHDHRRYQRLRDVAVKLSYLFDESKAKLDSEKLHKLLEWLSTCPFHMHHKSVLSRLLPESGTWLSDHSVYRNWLQSSSSSIMLLRGVRGCGKSSIFSVMVDRLLSENQSSGREPPVAYYYCADESSQSDRASPSAILRSILRQLAVDEKRNTIEPRILSEYERVAGSTKSRTNLIRLGSNDCVDLILELTMRRTAYIALDAIDELRQEARPELIESLHRIVNESDGLVKVLVTSRNDAQVEGLLQSATTIEVSPAENQCDIEKFVASQLGAVVRGRRLLNGSASETLLEKMRISLINGAQEMFLWIQLQLDSLCRKKTEHDIITALDAGLAGNLDKIYAETYKSFLELDKTAKSVVKGVVSWILYAKSPLTINALRCALKLNQDLASQPGEVTLPDLVDVCYNLVVLDSAMNTLRLCHPSARDYMRQQDMFSEASGNQFLAASCLEQCSQGLCQPPERLSSLYAIEDFSLYAALYWPEHTKKAVLPAMSTCTATEAMTRFIFDEEDGGLNVAFDGWLEWINQVLKKLPPYHALRMTHECVTSRDRPTPLFIACVFGLRSLLDLTLCNLEDIDLEQRSDTGHTPLYLACTFGHRSVTSKLLEHGADGNVVCGSYGNPLQAACFRGHIDVVKTLLDYGISARASTVTFKDALHAACEGSRANVADFLINTDSIINDGESYDDALQKTAEAGFRDAVGYLMKPDVARKFGRDTAKKERRQILVLGTIKKGRVDMMQCLLRSDLGITEDLPKDAMAIAASRGHVEMLDLLHDIGMDIEVEGQFGSPLRSASIHGCTRAVHRLLDLGADATATCPRGDPLQAASSKGHVHIMRLLISHGADVNKYDKSRGTYIQAAAYNGHQEAVKLLIEEGADIYRESKKFKDALQAAVQGGHLEIASFLQDRYPPPPGRGLSAIARGDHRERSWYSEQKNLDHMLERDRRSSSPNSEDADVECDIDSEESMDSSYLEVTDAGPVEYGLVFAATIGNISTIRQELLASAVAEDNISQALVAAAGKGNHRATEMLLEDGLRHVAYPRRHVEKGLLAAIKHRQLESVRMLADALEDNVSFLTWASALKKAAKIGERDILTQIFAWEILKWEKLGLEMLETPSLYSDETNDFPGQSRSCTIDDENESEGVTTNSVYACRDAIKTAYCSGHHEIANLIWNFILADGKGFSGAGFDEWRALSFIAARYADVLTLESCVAFEELCPDRPQHSLQYLLLAAVRGKNIRTFSRLFEVMEQESFDRSELFPSFMAACWEGFDAGVLHLLEREVVLQADEISLGMAAASASGNERLVLKLLNNLRCEQRGIAFINDAVQNALLSAAGAGESDVMQHILENTETRNHSEFEAIITRALVTACEMGHKNVVELCLDEGANAGMTVSKAHTNVVPDIDSRHSHFDQYCRSYLEQGLYSYHWNRPLSARSPSTRSVTTSSLDLNRSNETDALRASVKAFALIRHGENMPHFDTHFPSQRDKEQRQVEIVSLILDHMTGVSDYNVDQATHPLRIAARWGTTQVVQVLLKHGAADGFDAEQLTALVLLAAGRKTGIAHRIILELLNCDRETCLPTTEDGSLDPAILERLGDAIGMLHSMRFSVSRFLSKRGILTSEKRARDLMSNGLRQFIQIIFRKLPHQTAGGDRFGDVLHVAAVAGDLPIVRQLIKYGVDVNYCFLDHSTLGAAAEFGQVQVMKALTRAKASVHSDELEPISDRKYGAQQPAIKAILGGHVSALKFLLDEGANPNLNAGDVSLLLHASQSNNPAMLKTLLQAGADPKSDPCALVTAAHDGKLNMVNSLLDAGADANSLAIHGFTHAERHLCSPLYIACEQGHTEIVHVLLERGADANLDVGDRDGLPLVVAARQGHLDIVEVLLRQGCNPTHCSDGFEGLSAMDQSCFGPALCTRDFYLNCGPPQTRGDVSVPRDASVADTESIDSETEEEDYLNAIESACTGQKGVQASLKILKLLLKWVGDPDTREEVCLAAMQRVSEAQNERIFEALLECVPLDSVALDFASRCGSVKSVQTILGRGISINAASPGGKVPLQVAVDYGHWELIQFLLINGANLETSLDEDSPLDLYRLVALIIESYAFSTLMKHRSITKCEEIVQQLLKAAQDSGVVTEADQELLDSSLNLACNVGSVGMVTCLLQHSASLDSLPNLAGHSTDYHKLLFAAIEGNHPSILRILLQRVVNPQQSRGNVSSLDEVLQACLGKTSPVLLRTFLDCARTCIISEQILMLAAQKWKWERGPGDSDLQIILEHHPLLTPPEEVLLTLLSIAPEDEDTDPELHWLCWFVLKRIDCGVTIRMVQALRTLDLWKTLYDYYEERQAADSLTRGEVLPSHGPGNGIEDEFQRALSRIEALLIRHDPFRVGTKPWYLHRSRGARSSDVWTDTSSSVGSLTSQQLEALGL